MLEPRARLLEQRSGLRELGAVREPGHVQDGGDRDPDRAAADETDDARSWEREIAGGR
jgi:hypothetical protein